MIRTTAEASSSSFEVQAVDISTGAIQAYQIFWGWIKFVYPLMAGQSLQVCYCLAAPLPGITTAGRRSLRVCWLRLRWCCRARSWSI